MTTAEGWKKAAEIMAPERPGSLGEIATERGERDMINGKRLDLTRHTPRLSYDDLCERVGFEDPVTIYFDGLSRVGRLSSKYMLFFEGCLFVWEGKMRFRVVEWPVEAGREVKV